MRCVVRACVLYGLTNWSELPWWLVFKLIYKQLMLSDVCGCIGIRSEAEIRANTNYPPYVEQEMVLIDTHHRHLAAT